MQCSGCGNTITINSIGIGRIHIKTAVSHSREILFLPTLKKGEITIKQQNIISGGFSFVYLKSQSLKRKVS